MGTKGSKGFSLLEVMIATTIAGLMCVGVLGLMVNVDMNNRFLYNRTIAYRASHQAMEILLAEDIDSMILQDGNTFAVTETTSGSEVGTITITDLNWGTLADPTDKAYLVRLSVPRYSVVLTAVRTRT